MLRQALLRNMSRIQSTIRFYHVERNKRFFNTLSNKDYSTSYKYGLCFVTGSLVGIFTYRYLVSDKENFKTNNRAVQMCNLSIDDNSIKLGSFEGDQAAGSAEGGVMSRYAIADAVAKVAPAVVNITVTSEGPPSPWLGSIGPREVQQSSGSGFIIDPQGFILTNAHVVSEASHYTGQITVTLQDGRAFPGKLHSHDTLSDLAIVKVSYHESI